MTEIKQSPDAEWATMAGEMQVKLNVAQPVEKQAETAEAKKQPEGQPEEIAQPEDKEVDFFEGIAEKLSTEEEPKEKEDKQKEEDLEQDDSLPANVRKKLSRTVAKASFESERAERAERELADLRNQVNELKKVAAPSSTTQLDPTESLPAATQLTIDDFIDGTAEEKIRQSFKKQLEEAKHAEKEDQIKQERTKRAQEELKELDSFKEVALRAVDRFKERFEDYQEVVMEGLQVSNQMQKEIIRCGEFAPHVAYYLGKHPDVAQKLRNSAPETVIREIAKIESQARYKPVKKSTAPKPIEGGGRVSTAAASKGDIATTDAALQKLWNIPPNPNTARRR